MPILASPSFPVRRLAAAVLLATALPAVAVAQDAAPASATPTFRAGQWAAEFAVLNGVYGIGAIRFRGPTSAWLLDGDVSAGAGDSELTNTEQDGSQLALGLRVGLRRYRPLSGPVAAFTSVGLFGRAARAENEQRPLGGGGTAVKSEQQLLGGGVFGEIGGSYFVTRHLSLGAAATLNVGYSRTTGTLRTGDFEEKTESSTFSLQSSELRLLGTIYF